MTIAQLPIPDLMRPTAKRISLPEEEMLIDLFAGGGGASTGIEQLATETEQEEVEAEGELVESSAEEEPAQ